MPFLAYCITLYFLQLYNTYNMMNREECNDRTMANIKGEYCIVILHRKDLQQVTSGSLRRSLYLVTDESW